MAFDLLTQDRSTWVSENGKWRLTARVFEEIHGDEVFITGDVIIGKLNKHGRFELASIKELPRYVEEKRQEALKALNKRRMELSLEKAKEALYQDARTTDEEAVIEIASSNTVLPERLGWMAICMDTTFSKLPNGSYKLGSVLWEQVKDAVVAEWFD